MREAKATREGYPAQRAAYSFSFAERRLDKLTTRLEVKLADSGLDTREFEGHGSVFNNIDLGGDIVAPGAFKASLAEHARNGTMPAMFWMHDPSRIPGKWTEMREDDRGLYVKGVLAQTPLGDEARALLRMDAVSGLSIGYRMTDSDYDSEGNRIIKSATLFEVSIVSMPMNPKATVAAAKASAAKAAATLRDQVKTVREWESCLKTFFGISNRAAVRAASTTWKYIAPELSATAELDAAQQAIDEHSAALILRAASERIRRI